MDCRVGTINVYMHVHVCTCTNHYYNHFRCGWISTKENHLKHMTMLNTKILQGACYVHDVHMCKLDYGQSCASKGHL